MRYEGGRLKIAPDFEMQPQQNRDELKELDQKTGILGIRFLSLEGLVMANDPSANCNLRRVVGTIFHQWNVNRTVLKSARRKL